MTKHITLGSVDREMKNSKKAIAGLVALSVTYALPMTVSAATSGSQPVTLNLLVATSSSYETPEAAMYNKVFIPEFEKENPGIKVNFSTYNSSTQENTELQTSAATHQGPSIFEFGTSMVPTAYATKMFHVLSASDWAAIGGKSKFFSGQLTMSGPNPSHYIGVPDMMLPFAMLYNKTLFKKAGISSPPTTWTQFVNDAKRITNPAKNQWGTAIDPEDSYDPWKVGWQLTRQMGGNFLSSDLKTATIDSKASVQALTFWFDWVTKYHIASPNDLTYKSTDAMSAFENGNIGMVILQTATDIPSLKTSKVKHEYAFAPIPDVPYGMKSRPANGQPAQTIVSGQDLAIPTYVTGVQYQAALKWIKFFTDVKQEQMIFTHMGYLPVNKSAYNRSSHFNALNTPMMKTFVKSEIGADPTPFSGAWGNLEVVYAGVTNSIATQIATNTFQGNHIAKLLTAANEQVQSSLQ